VAERFRSPIRNKIVGHQVKTRIREGAPRATWDPRRTESSTIPLGKPELTKQNLLPHNFILPYLMHLHSPV